MSVASQEIKAFKGKIDHISIQNPDLFQVKITIRL